MARSQSPAVTRAQRLQSALCPAAEPARAADAPIAAASKTIRFMRQVLPFAVRRAILARAPGRSIAGNAAVAEIETRSPFPLGFVLVARFGPVVGAHAPIL